MEIPFSEINVRSTFSNSLYSLSKKSIFELTLVPTESLLIFQLQIFTWIEKNPRLYFDCNQKILFFYLRSKIKEVEKARFFIVNKQKIVTHTNFSTYRYSCQSKTNHRTNCSRANDYKIQAFLCGRFSNPYIWTHTS